MSCACSPPGGRPGGPSRSTGRTLEIAEAVPDAFDGVDIALFSAGADVSTELAPAAVARGATVIDNSSAWRMDPTIPLVVSQVNPRRPRGPPGHRRQPELLDDAARAGADGAARQRSGIERVVVDTYQSVSGTGADALAELEGQIRAHVAGEAPVANVYPHPIAFNALPEIDVFLPNGYTKEEWKVVNENRKILDLPDLRISCTAVRIPVFVSHSEAVHVETREPITPERARELFAAVPGVIVQDDPADARLPAGHRGRRPRRDLRRARPPRRLDRRTTAASRSGSSRTTCARARRRTPSSSPRSCASGTGSSPRPPAALGRTALRCPRGHGVTDVERRTALEAIAAEVRVCTNCRLHETRTKAVPGEGDPETEVVFVGEGPGFNEDRQGRPFVGRAGELLTELLGSIGWRREEVFITNVVKCRPPEQPRPAARRDRGVRPYLQRQLEVLDPAVVVTLGRHSMARSCPGERIARPTARSGRSIRRPARGTRSPSRCTTRRPRSDQAIERADATSTTSRPSRQPSSTRAGAARRRRDGPASTTQAARAPPVATDAAEPRPTRSPTTTPTDTSLAPPRPTSRPPTDTLLTHAKDTDAPPHNDQPLRIIPLGGVGEIGKNMYVFEYGDEIVVIDCGLMFPDEEMFGIDLVIPDITYLKERRANVKAFLITHAHEDHVGALPYVLPEFPGVPVYASTLARGLLGNKIKEHKLHNNPLIALEPGDELDIGAFHVMPFRVGHSIPDAMGIALRTPVGTIVHTGDFKFDHTPGRRQAVRLRDPGPARRRRASLCLLSDSTRAENPGYTPSERTVGEAFREIMEPLDGRVIVATFASNIARVQQVLDAAADMNRSVSVIGRSMEQNFRIATDLGYLTYDPSTDRPQGQDQGPPGRQARHRHDRRPGRADGRPGPDGQPRPPVRRDPAGRHGHRQRQPDPGQRGVRSRARSTTCSRPARTSTTTRSSAPTSRATPARKSSS